MPKKPQNFRIFFYIFDKSLSPEISSSILTETANFLNQWTSHGVPLIAKSQLLDYRLLIITIDEFFCTASGCSIDSLNKFLKNLSEKFNSKLERNSKVFFYQDKMIKSVNRDEISRLFKEGTINLDTIFLDTNIQTIEDFSQEKWKKPLRESWQITLIE